LDLSVNEEILKNFFSSYYSSVLGTKIIIDPSTKISKGYGFVKFGDPKEYQKSITEINGKILNGKAIKTK
jgi:RNA recognition motif-containing protein